jgi:hypothetical protein
LIAVEVEVRMTSDASDFTEILIESSNPSPDTGAINYSRFRFANNASWAVNWFLLITKAYCVIISSSKAIAASLVNYHTR